MGSPPRGLGSRPGMDWLRLLSRECSPAACTVPRPSSRQSSSRLSVHKSPRGFLPRPLLPSRPHGEPPPHVPLAALTLRSGRPRSGPPVHPTPES
ncbi:hypothetical protein C8Q79DRAFT_962801 [Trametes meyenii]|nr:hypothetical protein C8Q79DRAFT_962801 [Trametes meyenii]